MNELSEIFANVCLPQTAVAKPRSTYSLLLPVAKATLLAIFRSEELLYGEIFSSTTSV